MSKIEDLIKKLEEFKDILRKDDINEKIKAKIKAKMDKRKFSETDATRHIIDRDRGDKSPPAPKQPLLQTEREVLKTSSNGQWSLSKDNSVKPFGTSVYNSTANIGRKATRTGEERPAMGRNQGVRQYTTSGSSMQAANEAATAKEQKAKTIASTKTFANMSEEEKAEMRAKYEKPLTKGADIVQEALATGNLPVMGETRPQPTDQEMFGHLVVSEEQVQKAKEQYETRLQRGVEELVKPIDHLNKSEIDIEWGYGKSFNSLLSKEELKERNKYIGSD